MIDKDIQKGLSDRVYDKRKGAAVEVEQVIKDCLEDGNRAKIDTIIQQLSTDFAYAIHNPNARNGGLIGLAAAAIALGQHEVSHYLDDIVHPVLACFGDQDSRVRYYACESMYNIAKVAKGEILPYFNELFDALCKLSADSDETVQKGADLLNRLIKDIVSEKAATYVSVVVSGPPEVISPQVESTDPEQPVLANEPPQADKQTHDDFREQEEPQRQIAFSLPKFIPLLMERIYVINPAARTFLVSWITLLDSIPDLELVSYLPEFLSGLINFLNDSTNDVRVATHAALDNFLQEIRRITDVKKDLEQRRARIALQNQIRQRHIEAVQAAARQRAQIAAESANQEANATSSSSQDIQGTTQEGQEGATKEATTAPTSDEPDTETNEGNDKSVENLSKTLSSASISSGQTNQAHGSSKASKLSADKSTSIESTISESSAKEAETKNEGDSEQQPDNQLVVHGSTNDSTTLDSTGEIALNDSLPLSPIDNALIIDEEDFNDGEEEDDEGYYIPGQDVHINFERIIEILISHLDSSVEEIQIVVLMWIGTLLDISPESILPYGPRFLSVLLPTMAHDGDELRKAAERVNRKLLSLIMELPDSRENTDEDSGTINRAASNTSVAMSTISNSNPDSGLGNKSPNFVVDASAPALVHPLGPSEASNRDGTWNKLDYPAMVNALTLHFLDEKEETRVAALDWLIMLHRKVPKKILAINDGTFPALLKTLSDPSEQVITRDLKLLAQISYNSDDEYFTVFMVNLLNLFSTDRRLLETRGNLIIRQLCLSLKQERIYSTLADILEKEEEDLEFASLMVQYLNNILLTAPELSQLRMRLRNLKNKDGVTFFSALFRSWCHNPTAALTLCLLAQAYEYAFILLQTIVEFEITIPLLVQIDKLIQLLESPVFTHLRLQLLEPEKYPFLYKCLYGILMLLPQSSAFTILRNRLNSVSSIGYLHVPPPSHLQQMRSGSISGPGARDSSTSGNKVLNRVSGSTLSSSTVNSGSNSIYDVKWPELVKKFQAVQQKHQDARYKASAPGLQDTPPHIGMNGLSGFNRTTGPALSSPMSYFPGGSGHQHASHTSSPVTDSGDYFGIPRHGKHDSLNGRNDPLRDRRGKGGSNGGSWGGSSTTLTAAGRNDGSGMAPVSNVASRYLNAGGVMSNVASFANSRVSRGGNGGNSSNVETNFSGPSSRRPTAIRRRNELVNSGNDTDTDSYASTPKGYNAKLPPGNIVQKGNTSGR